MLAAWQITITRADVALAIAVFGAALGIWNAWTGWRRDRISLTVIPKLYRVLPGGMLSWSVDNTRAQDLHSDAGTKLCVEIMNNSRCAVTVEEVGFYRRRGSTRFVLLQHFLSEEKGKLPFRLEIGKKCSPLITNIHLIDSLVSLVHPLGLPVNVTACQSVPFSLGERTK